MADCSDVENGLTDLVDAVRVGLGRSWSIYRGWPQPAAIDAAMAAGQTHVTVWPDPAFYRVTAVTETQEWVLSAPNPTLTVAVSGTTATFAGTCSPDQIAGVRAGTTAWAVRCSGADTPTTIASSLAALCGGTASGSAVTLTGLADAKTGRDVTVVRGARWQEAGIRIIVWSPTPVERDLASSAIDAHVADAYTLAMPDGTAAILRAGGSLTTDKNELSNNYRRDLRYKVEYLTTTQIVRTPVLWPGLTYQPGSLRYGALHS